jgi:mRNA-degrading endonuclease RelE of RelBE toxin-antitoxin system
MHKATKRFWFCLHELPEPIQKIAKKNFDLLKENPKHPSLHFKRVGKLWSARVGLNHRALSVKTENNFIWVWIGTHEEYERLIK